MTRLPLWTSSFDPASGQSRFQAGRLGQIWYAPGQRCWRWKAVGRSGHASELSQALSAAQDAIVTQLDGPPPELCAISFPPLEPTPRDHQRRSHP